MEKYSSESSTSRFPLASGPSTFTRVTPTKEPYIYTDQFNAESLIDYYIPKYYQPQLPAKDNATENSNNDDEPYYIYHISCN
jgi:hypothetical protein